MFTPYLKYFIRTAQAPIKPNTTREMYYSLSRFEPMMFRASDDAYIEWKRCTLVEFEQMKEHHNAGGLTLDRVAIMPESVLTIITETEARADFVRWV